MVDATRQFRRGLRPLVALIFLTSSAHCIIARYALFPRETTSLSNVNKLRLSTARCCASAVLAMGLCLSVTSRCSIETAERIELGFGMLASFHPSYTVLKGNSVIFKNKGTSLWNFVLNSGLIKFRHGISIVETCYQLSSRKVDAQSVINWAVVDQLSR